jgi:uncharacterized C2H2 Zn-finger protein
MANDEFKCDECGAKFPNEVSLERHIQMAHTHLQNACQECGMVFDSKSELDAHMRAAHPEKQRNPER